MYLSHYVKLVTYDIDFDGRGGGEEGEDTGLRKGKDK